MNLHDIFPVSLNIFQPSTVSRFREKSPVPRPDLASHSARLPVRSVNEISVNGSARPNHDISPPKIQQSKDS